LIPFFPTAKLTAWSQKRTILKPDLAVK